MKEKILVGVGVSLCVGALQGLSRFALKKIRRLRAKNEEHVHHYVDVRVNWGE